MVLLLTDKAIWPTYYDLPYMGWAALVCALVIVLVPQRFKVALAIILLLNASGDLGLYELYRSGFQYDKVIHFLSPLIATLALAHAYGFRRAIAIVLVGAIGWEFFEFGADALIKTHLFGVFRHQIFRDTVIDVVCNVAGIAIASVLYYYRGANERSDGQSIVHGGE